MKLDKRMLMSLAVVIIVLFAILFYSKYAATNGPGIAYKQFSFHGTSYNITYIATNESEWEHGLMNTTVTNTTSELFEFPGLGIYQFWMYDTQYPLTMMWLNVSNRTGHVVYIVDNATPCSVENACATYTPNRYANFVLETASGFAAKHNVTVGTNITLVD